MRVTAKLLFLLAITVSLQGCSEDTVVPEEHPAQQKAYITFLVTPNGLGDNGYGDNAAKGIFAFHEEKGVPVRLLRPQDMNEAEAMYRQWTEENAMRDSAVLIVGSSSYEDLLKRNPPMLTGQGSRVLLFESNEQIDGVSTVMVNRYGAAYLSGAMSKDFDAFILAAAPGFATLEDAIAGFRDGHSATGDGTRTLSLQYLAEGEEGFAMPDSAYRLIFKRSEEYFNYDEMIFPLLGGSVAGIIKYLGSNEFVTALSVGMDVDQTGQSTRIPFSLIVHMDKVLKSYLNTWKAGKEWPSTQRLGLLEGATGIAITPHFLDHLIVWDERYEDSDTFLNLYNDYLEEAEKKEIEYEQR